jgi:hypothetical protein
MKIKFPSKFILGIVALLFFIVIFNMLPARGLSEERAFLMLFGNYDALHKNSIWRDIKFPDKRGESGFWAKKTGIVSSILFQPYHEDGKKKIFLLTKTIPINIPFNCHACLPLLGATVFSMEKDGWKVESQNRFLMYAGEYGESPTTQPTLVGKDKLGLLLEFEHRGEGFSKEIALLIPHNKSIKNSHQETIFYRNFYDCGWSMQCASFTAKFEFNQLKTDDFYELKITRFGTENDKKQNYKAIPVDEEVTYRFTNGIYSQVARKDIGKIKYIPGV